jgi:hypothetical protein
MPGGKVVMGIDIQIEKIDIEDVKGDGSDVITIYGVSEGGKMFTITLRSNLYGRTAGISGQEGSLYIDAEDNKVHRQVVALGGGCGLIITEEVVEGLSPHTLRALFDAK